MTFTQQVLDLQALPDREFVQAILGADSEVRARLQPRILRRLDGVVVAGDTPAAFAQMREAIVQVLDAARAANIPWEKAPTKAKPSKVAKAGRQRYCGPCDAWVGAKAYECPKCGADTEKAP